MSPRPMCLSVLPPFLHRLLKMMLSHASGVQSIAVSREVVIVVPSLSANCCGAGGEIGGGGGSPGVKAAVSGCSIHARVKPEDGA